MKREDINVKYAVKAGSDVKKSDSGNFYGVHMTIGSLENPQTVIYKASSVSESAQTSLENLSPTWYETHETYTSPTAPLQHEYGKFEFVENVRDRKSILPKRGCMFWAPMEYQQDICLVDIDASYNLFLIGGKLLKRKFENAALPGGVVSPPFFHFQEWKRKYRVPQLSALSGAKIGEASGYVINRVGIYGKGGGSSASSAKSREQILTVGGGGGRLIVGGFESYPLPSSEYCGAIETKRKEGKMVTSCIDRWSWADSDRVEVAMCPRIDPKINLGGGDVVEVVGIDEISADITLVLTLRFGGSTTAEEDYSHLKMLKLTLKNWQSRPAVLVVYYEGSNDDFQEKSIAQTFRDEFGSEFASNLLLAVVHHNEGRKYNRNSLLNMANDAARTRWILTGLHIDNGDRLSDEALQFASLSLGATATATATASATATATETETETGSIFLIPQFSSATVGDKHEISTLMEIGELEIDSDSILGSIAQAWFSITRHVLKTGEGVGADVGAGVGERMEMEQSLLDEAKKVLIKNLTEMKFGSQHSPVMLIDALGPYKGNGQLTELIGREEEAYGNCAGMAKTAQLLVLGYKMSVLAGAFVTTGNELDGNAEDCSSLMEKEDIQNILSDQKKLNAKMRRSMI